MTNPQEASPRSPSRHQTGKSDSALNRTRDSNLERHHRTSSKRNHPHVISFQHLFQSHGRASCLAPGGGCGWSVRRTPLPLPIRTALNTIHHSTLPSHAPIGVLTTFNPQWGQIAPPVGTLQGQAHRPPPGARALEQLASQGPMGSNPRGTRPGRGHSVEKSFFKRGFSRPADRWFKRRRRA